MTGYSCPRSFPLRHQLLREKEDNICGTLPFFSQHGGYKYINPFLPSTILHILHSGNPLCRTWIYCSSLASHLGSLISIGSVENSPRQPHTPYKELPRISLTCWTFSFDLLNNKTGWTNLNWSELSKVSFFGILKKFRSHWIFKGLISSCVQVLTHFHLFFK